MREREEKNAWNVKKRVTTTANPPFVNDQLTQRTTLISLKKFTNISLDTNNDVADSLIFLKCVQNQFESN